MYNFASLINLIPPVRVKVRDLEVGIETISYDTRKLTAPLNSLFFALKNVRDGHEFIAEAYAKGVRNFVVSKLDLDTTNLAEANIIWVADVLQALQTLAKANRSSFQNTLIGITGSNGKTVVKEWLTQLLKVDNKVYRSPKSFNSQLGVALSLWSLNDTYDYALIEAGISLPGEMELLEDMIKPTIGIFTNIGLAHAEGFASKEEKIREKMKLFKNATHLIYPSKYGLKEYLPEGVQGFSFGEEEADDLRVMGMATAEESSYLELQYRGQLERFDVSHMDRASIENTLTCVATLLFLGVDFAKAIARSIKVQPLAMRLELKTGKNNCSIIDDSYSNDIASLEIALDFLNQQRQHDKKTLILSDMEGLDDKMRAKLLKLLTAQKLHRILLVGSGLHYLQDKLSLPTSFFDSTKELIAQSPELAFEDESILIKGSRAFQLEDLSALLVAKSHETVLEINLDAVQHNLQEFRSLLPSGVKTMAMVKAFSYGSGSFEIANLLQFNKVDYLTVAFADEGAELRANGISLPIMVLSPDEQAFDSILKNKLEAEIYSARILHAFIDYVEHSHLGKAPMQVPIHIKVDTGMHRLGFLPEDMPKVLERLAKTDALRVVSVLTHLVASGDTSHDDFTRQQIASFNRAADVLEEGLGYSVMRHVANTSAIVHWPEAHMDMVRLGVGLYGIDMGNSGLKLEVVSRLVTTITQIKELKAGETVGYDRKGLLTRDSRIATVKIGYADGYDRRFGNGVGEMMVNGQLVKTVGNICMDMCMLDVTDVLVREESEVLVFPDVMKAAEAIGTIPYELLVSISSRVKRVYFYS